VVGNKSIDWIREKAKAGGPWLAYVAPKACHEPFNPAPWYVDHWDRAWPDHEPRTVNWNMTVAQRAGHHGAPGANALLTEEAGTVITDVFKNRWRTLMSVDDVVAAVIAEVEALGLSDSTYFFYSSGPAASAPLPVLPLLACICCGTALVLLILRRLTRWRVADHGFQLGQFNIPMDKRQVGHRHPTASRYHRPT
jgi:arylsulfatase A-like enzyme